MTAEQILRERCDRFLPGGYEAFFPAVLPVFRGMTVNRLRSDPARFPDISPFPVSKSPFSECGFLLSDPDAKPGIHPHHHAGVYYVQEPSASAPAGLLDVRPGQKVLDLCAAPGGKTAQIAAMLGGRGFLAANEVSATRMPVLLGNMERLGITNAAVLNETPERIGAAYEGFFDRILVDAPCSGEGMFRKSGEARSQYSQKLVESCAALQIRILLCAAKALKPGGLLLYSTCTFSPEENECSVCAFLSARPDFEPVTIRAAFGCPGHRSFCSGRGDVSAMRHIYPVHGGEGQFMALFRRVSGQLPEAVSPLSGVPLRGPALDFFRNYFPSLAGSSVSVRGDSVFLLPEDGVFVPRGLRAVRIGVHAGDVRAAHAGPARFEPSHSLYMAYGQQSVRSVAFLPDSQNCLAWLHGEELPVPDHPDGYCAVLERGFPVGFGKISGGILKNHYPRGLRNLK